MYGPPVSARVERWWLAVIVAATAGFGVAYLLVMPPGLPYDEPSHWFNVEFYLDHRKMPVIDEGGATYEAQMGPIAYVLAALVAAPFDSTETAFYAVRALGVVQLLALVLVARRLTLKTFPDHPWPALLAAAVVGLNPMLLAMAASVQNDVLAILLAGVALDLATEARSERSEWSTSPGRGLLVGLVVGAAMLTKVSIWPVALVLGPWLLWRSGIGATVLYALAAVSVSGWWFVRNLRLYGDLTGKAGVDAAGYEFPPLGWDPVEIVRESVTTLWIPVEYVRNAISAPLAVEGAVGLLTLLGLIGLVVAWRRFDTTGWLLTAVAVVSVVGWLVVTISVQAVSFRIAFPALFAWSSGLGAWATLRQRRPVTLLLVCTLAALNGWFLAELVALEDPGLLPVT